MARPKPEPGAASSARTPRCNTTARISGGTPGPVVFDRDEDVVVAVGRREAHVAARVLARVVEQVAEHLVEILALAAHGVIGRRLRRRSSARGPRAAARSVRARPSADVATAHRAPGVAPEAAARACAR